MREIDYKALIRKDIADILVVTATKLETSLLHSAMGGVCREGLLKVKADDCVYFAGTLGGMNIIHCQCGNTGTQEKNSSILTTQLALQHWPNVKCVIMAGIAFGMYENDPENPQCFSDVLVAEKIFPYENQRLNKDGSVKYRGTEHRSDTNLLNAFSEIAKGWTWKNLKGEECRIQLCPLLSGEKLVDNLEKRDALKNHFKEYRGGEMEGIGLAAVCDRHHIPWILLKGICDFGDGNKGQDNNEAEKRDKEAKQENAAAAAVDACIRALQSESIKALILKPLNYFYRPEDFDSHIPFFIRYEKENEEYYLERDVDSNIAPFVLQKNCWVYGLSGMGKSNLLIRTLIVRDIPHIYVDCSLASKDNHKSLFIEILNEICDNCGSDIDVDEDDSLKNIAKKLCSLLDSHYPDKTLYIVVDEIPYDFNSEVFAKFAENFCFMVGYMQRSLKSCKVLFMLSSIESPVDTFSNAPGFSKFHQYIKFVELKTWSAEECFKLIDMLTAAVGLEWGDITAEDFIRDHHYSPREIKNTLHEICMLGCRLIDSDSIDKVHIVR